MVTTVRDGRTAEQRAAGTAAAVECDSDCHYCYGAETD